MTYDKIFLLLGGVGLFLYGMSIMSTGLRSACGDNIRVILEGATKSKIRAVLVGIIVTMLIQSSSATDVMVIGFVNSGFMSLTQAIGVIMGANIGTTITAQITAFDLGKVAPMIIFVGAVMFMFLKKEVLKHVGCVIMGFGMLFQGISMMKSVIKPLSETAGFMKIIEFLTHSNPLLIVLFGILFTAILQSSSSATVIFQAFAVSGIIDYRVSVFLIIGSAVGSVTPNLLASLTTNRNGKRTACLNLIFNLCRACILIVALTIFPALLKIAPTVFAGDPARQIAMTHTTFAIVTVLLLLPVSDYIVKLSKKIIPERAEETRAAEAKKLHFMQNLADVPAAIAVNQAKREIARMGHIAYDNLELAIKCFMTGDFELAETVEEIEDVVNTLNNEILTHMVDMRTSDLSHRDLNRVYRLTLVVADIERISDHAENIIEYAEQFRKNKITLSEQPMNELKVICDKVLLCVKRSITVFENDEFDGIKEAEALEQEVDVLQEKAIDSHTKRLMEATCDPLGGIIFTDMVVDLERCSDHAANIAQAIAEL